MTFHTAGPRRPAHRPDEGQTGTIHLYKLRRDQNVHIVALFLPAIDQADSSHVPGDVETLVERMLAVARESGAQDLSADLDKLIARVRILQRGERALRACAAAKVSVRASDTRVSSSPSKGSGPASGGPGPAQP